MDYVYSHDAQLFRSICEIVPNLSVRYLTSRDHCSDLRLEWVKGIFEQVEVYDLISQDTYAVSLARGRYDVLIVGVNDAGRIAKFGRSNGRVRQRGVNSVVASGLHFQAAFGVICSG